MKCFRHPEDRLPAALFVLLFFLDLVVFFLVRDRLLVILWMLIGLGPKACICAWNHHHQHVATFHQVWLNRLMELVYSFQTGITTNAWVLHHNLGHHIHYLDQTKDESTWRSEDGRTMRPFEYTVKTALTGYVRAYQVGKRYPKYQQGLLQMGVVVLALLILAFLYNPFSAFVLFLIPMLTGYIVTVWHTYYHHAGLDSDDHMKASYNIMHKWYNILTGNLGYHTAHHYKQAVHWSKLPELHRKIEESIPPELYREPCIPFKWMPAA